MCTAGDKIAARGRPPKVRELLSPTPEDGPPEENALPPKLLGARRVLESDASATSSRIQHGVMSPHSQGSEFGSSTLGSASLTLSSKAVSLDAADSHRRSSVALSLPDRTLASTDSSQLDSRSRSSQEAARRSSIEAGSSAAPQHQQQQQQQPPLAEPAQPRELRERRSQPVSAPVARTTGEWEKPQPRSRLWRGSSRDAGYNSDPSSLGHASSVGSSLASAASLQVCYPGAVCRITSASSCSASCSRAASVWAYSWVACSPEFARLWLQCAESFVWPPLQAGLSVQLSLEPLARVSSLSGNLSSPAPQRKAEGRLPARRTSSLEPGQVTAEARCGRRATATVRCADLSCCRRPTSGARMHC